MRIIAGEFRGRKLLPPEGLVTRPITDRVKQSLFDIVTPLLAEARIYDVFAGTGSMGLESLSRGASHATFFESHRSATARLRRNIDSLGLGARCTVISTDLFKWFTTATDRTADERVSLVYLDPPYRFLNEQSENLRLLARRLAEGHLTVDGSIVFRHDAGDRLDLPGLEQYDQRDYGPMIIEFLRPARK